MVCQQGTVVIRQVDREEVWCVGVRCAHPNLRRWKLSSRNRLIVVLGL
jgi:hypothetical protein